MKTYGVVILLGTLINGANSMTHSLKYFDTGSTKVPNLPEFVAVFLLNDLQIIHFDSETNRVVFKQDWMNKLAEEDPQERDMAPQLFLGLMGRSKRDIELIKQNLNLTEGVHVFQRMSGCEWNNKTNETSGYLQLGFDGEDILSLDLKTETWVALNPQAVIIKHIWDMRGGAAFTKNLVSHMCLEYLKELVRYEKRTLKKKKELPLVSLLQKTSSSPVTCHATGFYPDRAMLYWTKDGEELHENVYPGEILPNHDGTFQMSVDLDVSSLPFEDWEKYKCVFKLSEVKEDILTRLDRAVIRTNKKDYTPIIAAVLAVLGVAIFTVVGVVLYRRFRNNVI